MQSIPRTQHNTTNYTAARFQVPRPCTYIAHRPSVRRVFVFVSFISVPAFVESGRLALRRSSGVPSLRVANSLQRWVGSGACTVYVDIPVWREGEGVLCTSTLLYHFHVPLFLWCCTFTCKRLDFASYWWETKRDIESVSNAMGE